MRICFIFLAKYGIVIPVRQRGAFPQGSVPRTRLTPSTTEGTEGGNSPPSFALNTNKRGRERMLDYV